MGALAAVLFVALVIAIVAGQAGLGRQGGAIEAAAPAGPAGKDELRRVVGRWVRPDGGYILELRDVDESGALDAAYFNPRPINVATARASETEAGVEVFVELRDVNYPGSTYMLQYDPTADRLIGTYYQAVYRETYQVFFARAR